MNSSDLTYLRGYASTAATPLRRMIGDLLAAYDTACKQRDDAQQLCDIAQNRCSEIIALYSNIIPNELNAWQARMLLERAALEGYERSMHAIDDWSYRDEEWNEFVTALDEG